MKKLLAALVFVPATSSIIIGRCVQLRVGVESGRPSSLSSGLANKAVPMRYLQSFPSWSEARPIAMPSQRCRGPIDLQSRGGASDCGEVGKSFGGEKQLRAQNATIQGPSVKGGCQQQRKSVVAVAAKSLIPFDSGR